MEDKKIKTRVRLIIIKNDKILLSYTEDEDFYFYIGGKIEFGETVKDACIREVQEECHANFTFRKILYIRDFILPEIDEHSIEFFILGDVDKFEEIEGIKDEEFDGRHWQTWVDINKLPQINIKPKTLTENILASYKNGFSNDTEYVGIIE